MRRSCTETIFQIEESVLIGCSSVIETMDCKCLCNFTALSLHQIFSFFFFFFTNNRISSKLCMFLAHWYTHETSNFLTAFCYSGDDLTPLSYYVSLAESRADSQRKKEREGCTLFFFFYSRQSSRALSLLPSSWMAHIGVSAYSFVDSPRDVCQSSAAISC